MSIDIAETQSPPLSTVQATSRWYSPEGQTSVGVAPATEFTGQLRQLYDTATRDVAEAVELASRFLAASLSSRVSSEAAVVVQPAGVAGRFVGIAAGPISSEPTTALLIVQDGHAQIAAVADQNQIDQSPSFAEAALNVVTFEIADSDQLSEAEAAAAILRSQAHSAVIALSLVDSFANQVRALRGNRYVSGDGTDGFRLGLESILGRYLGAAALIDELLAEAVVALDHADGSFQHRVGYLLSGSVERELVPLVTDMFDSLGARFTFVSFGLDRYWRALSVLRGSWVR